MLQLIDRDIEYRMREDKEATDEAFITWLHCERLYHARSVGFQITDTVTRIRLFTKADEGFEDAVCLPTLLVFDALDGRVHPDDTKKKELMYLEYGQFRFDGRVTCEAARRIETSVKAREAEAETPDRRYTSYIIEAFRVEDHVLIRVSGGRKTVEHIVALPDSSRFSYIALTGEHCLIRSIHVDEEDTEVEPDCIPRIAEEISYIRDCPQGDVPNVQVNRWRSAATRGIPVTGNMRLAFHTQSLPTARLIWHCPYVSVFTSKDGTVGGEGYREFLLLRLDGESWDSDEHAVNQVECDHTGAFDGWNTWKEKNREGFDCRVDIQREGRTIKLATENLGVQVTSVTTIKDEVSDIYVALTGDQCALTDIRISHEAEKGEL